MSGCGLKPSDCFASIALHPASSGTATRYSIARLAGGTLDATEDLLGLLERQSLIARISDRMGVGMT